MARTGNPRGRPKGSGLRLGAQQTRVTIRLPQALYDRLDAYAAGRHFTRGTTQLADCVRELLEHALACPYKRQIKNIPMALEQPPAPHRNSSSLPDNRLEEPLPPMGDTPAYDQAKYHLGQLCLNGHDYQGSGQSLRANNKARYCIACNKDHNLAYQGRRSQQHHQAPAARPSPMKRPKGGRRQRTRTA